MKKILTLLGLAAALPAISQNYTLEKLNAYKIDNSILFRIETVDGKKALTYEIDTRDEALVQKITSRSHEVKGNKLPLASTGTSFNILLDFFNPLRFSCRIDDEVTVDPTNVAFEDFYQSVVDIARKLNMNVDVKTPKAENLSDMIQRSFKVTFDSAGTALSLALSKNKAVQAQLENLKRIKSEELLAWALWYTTNFKTAIAKPVMDEKNREKLDKLYDLIIQAEKKIYNPVDDKYLAAKMKSSGLFYEPYIAKLFEMLSRGNSFDQFTKDIDTLKVSIQKLKQYNADLKSIQESINQVHLDDINSSTSEAYFLAITMTTQQSYLDKLKSITDNRDDLLKKFEALIADVEAKYIITRSSPITTKPYVVYRELGTVTKVGIEITEVTYTINGTDVKKKEAQLYNFELTVYDYVPIVGELGLGTIYYPKPINVVKYGLDGDGVIFGTSGDKVNILPTTSLNLIPNIGRGMYFPMIQIAVATTVITPTFALGAGLRVYNVRQNIVRNFSFSAGMALSFTKDLNVLDQGDTTTQEVLDADLHFVPNFRPYIGFQFNF